MRTLIATIIVVATGCSVSHHRVQMASLALFTAEVACDVHQTLWWRDGGRWDRPVPGAPYGTVTLEGDPLAGPRPSANRLIIGGAIAVGIAAIVAFSHLNESVKTTLLVTAAILEGGNVGANMLYNTNGRCGGNGEPHVEDFPVSGRPTQ